MAQGASSICSTVRVYTIVLRQPYSNSIEGFGWLYASHVTVSGSQSAVSWRLRGWENIDSFNPRDPHTIGKFEEVREGSSFAIWYLACYLKTTAFMHWRSNKHHHISIVSSWDDQRNRLGNSSTDDRLSKLIALNSEIYSEENCQRWIEQLVFHTVKALQVLFLWLHSFCEKNLRIIFMAMGSTSREKGLKKCRDLSVDSSRGVSCWAWLWLGAILGLLFQGPVGASASWMWVSHLIINS